MPASIYSRVQDSAPVNTATLSSTFTSLTTTSCESTKAIQTWLDNIEKSEVTVIGAELEDRDSELAQEPDVRSTCKRKHSSPSFHEDSSPSSPHKRIRHNSQHTPSNTMAGDSMSNAIAPPATSNAIEPGQMPISPQRTSVAETPTTPSTVAKFKVPADAGWVGDSLAEHGLHCDFFALRRYPEFEEKILQIINGDRHSQMKPKSVQRIQKNNEICQRTNEATFLGTLLPLIIKVDRTVGFNKNDLAAQELELIQDGDTIDVKDPEPGMAYASRDWLEDGVFAAIDQDFRNDLLPHRYVDEQLAAAMKKDDSMLTPRPDRCYGLLSDWIPAPKCVKLNPEIRALIQACPNVSHSFFIIEGKSNKGVKIDAENQARRGGACLVNAMRQLLLKIGEPFVADNGVDDHNFLFSATLSPGVMDIWVHWAELENGIPDFHMSWLKSSALRDGQQAMEIRKALDNILCWGCDLKDRRLPELHEKVYAWQRKETIRLQEEAQRKDSEKKANRKRQRT